MKTKGLSRRTWQLIFALQRLITRVAPPLHSIHWKVFFLFLLVLLLPVGYVGWQLRDAIERSYLHSTEEGMIDTAAVIAELYARLLSDHGEDLPPLTREFQRAYSQLNQTYEIKARLFGYSRKEVDTRIIVYDRQGHTIFDTMDQIPAGTDFSSFKDLRAALAGSYGSRWQVDTKEQRLFLFSTLPVFLKGRLAGAVTVSKPTNRIRHFVTNMLRHLVLPAFLTIASAAGLAYLLSAYITRTVAELARRAERVAAGESGVRLETWTKSELGDLARAVEKMRRKLEGKAYVEEMAGALSHELKTPLAAIRGAAELLEDGAMQDANARQKFLKNIGAEVRRLDQLVNELLRLTRIETRPGEMPSRCDLAEVAREMADLYSDRAETFGVKFSARIGEGTCPVPAPADDVRLLISNLLDNAIQFTPSGGEVSLQVEGRCVVVRDGGAGIPSDILPKVFDRFFTTGNPRTGNRGTGLGLAIVKAILQRAGGNISVNSVEGRGAEFTAKFPKPQSLPFSRKRSLERENAIPE